LLARARSPGAGGGHGEEGEREGLRRLLPPARPAVAGRRLGLAPERAAGGARRARAALRRAGEEVRRRRGAPPEALGRVPAAAHRDRAVGGAGEPAPRARALPEEGQPLGAPAAPPVATLLLLDPRESIELCRDRSAPCADR